MGKQQNAKTKRSLSRKSSSKSTNSPSSAKSNQGECSSPKVLAYDKDNALFIAMSNELKNEGNKLFQKRDYEGALLKYEKSIKLLPRNHVDVSYLRSNMAESFMQMGLTEFPKAIRECNLALEVTPKYSKALLKRSRCYEGLNRLDLAMRDVNIVLDMEPRNIMALEIAERVQEEIEEWSSDDEDSILDSIPVPEYVDPLSLVSNPAKALRQKLLKKKLSKITLYDKDEEGDDAANNEDKKPELTVDATSSENKEAEDNTPELKVDGATSERKFEHETGQDKKLGVKVDSTAGEEEAENKNAEVKFDATRNGNKFEEETENKKAELMVDAATREKRFVEPKLKPVAIRSEKKFLDEAGDSIDDKKTEDKLVVEEKIASKAETNAQRSVKLVFGEDIRCTQIPVCCSILKLREAIGDRFPVLRGVLVKYRDQEGDLVTITTTDELRLAEAAADHGSLRLYLVEVNPEQDPLFDKLSREGNEHGMIKHKKMENGNLGGNAELLNQPVCIEDWIIQFAHLFKKYIGFDPDSYLDLNELGMKLYSEGLEEVVTSEEAQDSLSMASDKFQEMAALALFNSGNVHMSRARKRVYFSEDASKSSALEQVKVAYEWAQKQYSDAGKKYEEALRIMPNFYEAILALGQQQFERAKLSWYYAVGNNVDLETWPFTEVLELYNKAEEHVERGMLMLEDAEEMRLHKLQNQNTAKGLLQKMKLVDMIKDISEAEATEQVKYMRSQINVLWGTMLYERSLMEYKIGLPVWHECLEVAIEKFELAGASATDIAVMMKNHCCNDTASEGLGFNIDEIVQAWNEMYEAKKWQSGIPSFRLEPVLRRRVSKLYHALGHT